VRSKIQAPPVTWSEKERPQDVHVISVNRRVSVEPDDDNYRRPPPDFKIPKKPTNNRRRHFQVTRDHSPSNDLRHGRFGGFSHGFCPDGCRGRGNPRTLPFSHPERIPGLSPDEQECIDRMRRSRGPSF